MSDWNTQIIEEFRANDGKMGGNFDGAPMLLLNTTGAKSGQTRVAPVVYLEEDGHIYVFASKAGAPTNPDWYHNLVANPEVTVERGAETYTATASVITGDERDRIFGIQKGVMPGFADYETKTDRIIPVVELTRKS
jgi:deazaflavin-dependent oxidoreductase (nitroreductase family)